MNAPSLTTRRSVWCGAALALAVTTIPANGQETERVLETGRTPRRYVLPWVGAAVGGLASLVYFWSGPRSLPGTCSQPVCVAIASLGSGALVGWLVGREKDELHELRYRGAQPLRPANTAELVLSGEPLQLSLAGGVAAVSGAGGVHLVTSTDRLRLMETRAAGLRGITDAVLVPSEQLLGLTASAGLYRFPVSATGSSGLGTTLRGAPATAVAVLGTDFIVAAGRRVERVARSANDMAEKWPGITLDDSVRAIDVDERDVLWAATATQLLALRPAGDSLTVISRTAIPRGSTTRVDVAGNLAAVALGDSGVRFIAVEDPTAPRPIADWRDTRYVHDAAIAGGRVFVAAGIDGIVVLSLDGSTLTQHGIMREMGMAVAVEADDRYVWVLDRSAMAAKVRRFPIQFR